jgi:arylsulfatase A-like enzyme
VKAVRHILFLAFLLMVSCASDKEGNGDGSGVPVERKGARIMDDQTWLAEKTKDIGYKQDAAGNWTGKSNKRSSFETKGESPYFKGDYSGKEYKTGEYQSKSWWGNKQFGNKKYDGKTDGGRFMTASRDDGKSARESGSSAGLEKNHSTGTYATGAAREAGKTGVEKTADAETAARRRVFDPPDIIDWREQRTMDIQQSRNILGR